MKKSIHKIAKEAGVSVATVSRVINDSPRVHTKTRAKILKVIEKNQYAPKPIKGRTTMVTVLLHGVEYGSRHSWFEPYVRPILDGLMEHFTEKQVGVAILPIPSAWTAWRVFDGVRKRFTAGVISLLSKADDPALALLAEHKIPFLVVNNSACEKYHRIGTDNARMVELLIHHALEKGKKRFIYLSPSLAFTDHRERLNALKQKIEHLGLPLEVHVDEQNTEFPDNYLAGKNLTLAANPKANPETALICGNPEIATGCLRALGERGLSVPRDLGLGVLDDYLSGEWLFPSLTASAQPLRAMGTMAAQMLLGVLQDRGGEPRHLILEPALAARESL